jgi:glycosyltransferase involved in cell wall biosynthesis
LLDEVGEPEVSSGGASRGGRGERPRPLLSVIIPVFDIADYLTRCLDSITRQAFRDIEIIAVDGASQDDSGKILDEMSREEPRLRVVHIDQRGPGRARREGMKLARGEYVWFVDGDDLISADCLALIANRIEATRPDVLFIDHEAFYPGGKSELGDGHELMGRETAESFTLAEQPWVIDFSMASWKKIVDREFFLASPAHFWLESPHEEIEASCVLLMEAHRLSILDQVCYLYQKGRPGSAMSTGDPRRHFLIFRAYRAVLDDVGKRASNGERGMTEGVQHGFFQRAIWHYTTILDDDRGLIAPEDRHEFFDHMHSDYLHYRPPGFQRPGGLRGIKFWLIEKGAYRIYVVLDPVNKIRLRAWKAVS